ncbi:Mce-associated membrane protein [Micromonospora inositola]|uniref:Mce-associated membrane protein n=1 Tax=Micromonospora inositola TaxID=47865 RepID=A0A1C5JKB5_9ACTN|nr:Mce-associated membrane protein [Micromonospora inositola]
MQDRKDPKLRVINGAKPGAPGRPRQRRLVARAVPRPAEPIEEVLERLDREPVEDPTGTEDRTVIGDPAEVEDLPARAAADDGSTDAGTPGRRRALLALLVVLLAAALAGAGYYGHRWYVDRATDQARQDAVAAARQASVNFVSVSAASVDRDLQRIVARATGDFKDEFTRGQAQVRKAVVENKVQSQGSVLRAGLVSGDRSRAVVLVAVDATVKNVKAPDGRPSHYRIQVDLVRDRDSGDWLVSKLQFVG